VTYSGAFCAVVVGRMVLFVKAFRRSTRSEEEDTPLARCTGFLLGEALLCPLLLCTSSAAELTANGFSQSGTPLISSVLGGASLDVEAVRYEEEALLLGLLNSPLPPLGCLPAASAVVPLFMALCSGFSLEGELSGAFVLSSDGPKVCNASSSIGAFGALPCGTVDLRLEKAL